MKNYQKNQKLALNFQQEIKPIIKDYSYFLLIYTFKNQEKGSLIIRIFFYLIISGFLVAIALPSYFHRFHFGRPRGCAPWIAGKNAVGTLNRTQQIYHFEKQTFASNIQDLGVTLPESKDYNFLLEATPGASYALSLSKNYQKDQPNQPKSYSGATFFEEKINSYQQIICETNEGVEKPTKPILKKGILTCPQNMTEIK